MVMDLEGAVRRYQSGESLYFEIIYNATHKTVYLAIFQYFQDKEIVNDLSQDTYMKMIKNIGSYKSNNFNAWIYRMAKNIAIDYYRKKKESLLPKETVVKDDDYSPYMKYAISKLNEEEREVFLLKVLCGHTTKKLSLLLDKNVSLINSLYYQAKEKLKKELKEEEK